MLLDKIEFLKEEENLKKTLSILNDETLNYIEKSILRNIEMMKIN